MHLPDSHANSVPFDHVLPYFRAVMPGVAGVVLASATGAPLAHDLRDQDAARLARDAVDLHAQACGCAPLSDVANGASIFVPHREDVVLVVFMQATTAPGTHAPAAVAA